MKLKNPRFLKFGNDSNFDVTEELLPCMKSSRNSALNKLQKAQTLKKKFGRTQHFGLVEASGASF